MPVGKGHGDKPYTTMNSLQKDTMIFTFTDGYANRLIGPKGKNLNTNKSMRFGFRLPVFRWLAKKKILDFRFEERMVLWKKWIMFALSECA